ncbi:Crp/Fnr family transcriptional regulator [Sphingosinicella sp. LY1275]|uniref:Crp/Fnr family transcriptional regulator n=2 Tax=Sphingomonadales TaxID=204457 RepID=UPI002ADEE687|nr:Crp/Fnr family transcriptional regulator [Sphingosinicella sp. LY1275]MEA1013994.1 Crp/Fnr family transcriptional regulator [Sphingosinicella sp. LY1275]
MTGTVDRYEMVNVLTRRIEAFTRLSQDDRAILERMARRTIREVGARRDLIREGDAPRSVFLVLDGWACRYKTLPDGRRQIVSFFVPGDLCDLHIYILREMDHSIASITPVRVAEIARDDFEKLLADHPRLVQALWWDELVTMAIQREWTLNLGQRTAFERIAHLLCELYIRMQSVGQTNGNSINFPLTQVDLADATGLTAVHVNRTLQELRKGGLVELQSKTLTIPNMDALKDVAMFNDNYLHLDREGRHLDAND